MIDIAVSLAMVGKTIAWLGSTIVAAFILIMSHFGEGPVWRKYDTLVIGAVATFLFLVIFGFLHFHWS